MTWVDRTRSALTFALLVACAQAACLAVLAIEGALPQPTTSGRNPGPLIQFCSVLALLLAPLLIHERVSATRWAPAASRQATIVFSLGGLFVGYVLGRLLVEYGYVGAWTLTTRAGAVLGSFAALSILNLTSSGSSAP